jgi:hypothetical protein
MVRCPVSMPAFAGRRVVIFSGGAAVFDDEKLLDEIRAIHAGGGFGSIIGRSSFRRQIQRDSLNLICRPRGRGIFRGAHQSLVVKTDQRPRPARHTGECTAASGFPDRPTAR